MSDPQSIICSAPDCYKPAVSRGLCMTHYAHLRRANQQAICSRDGCGKPVQARGLCLNHYEELNRREHGIGPRKTARPRKPAGLRSQPLEVRFWAKVNKDGPTLCGLGPCWEWTGASLPPKRRVLTEVEYPNGYGLVGLTIDGHFKQKYTHRLAWEFATGDVPDGFVLHACDNPKCVRNDEEGIYLIEGQEYPRWGHLVLATAAANARDTVQKGRTRQAAATYRSMIEQKITPGGAANAPGLAARGLISCGVFNSTSIPCTRSSSLRLVGLDGYGRLLHCRDFQVVRQSVTGGASEAVTTRRPLN